jgi:hypothetical protein
MALVDKIQPIYVYTIENATLSFLNTVCILDNGLNFVLENNRLYI